MHDYVNPMEQSLSRPEAFAESVELSRMNGVTRAIVNIERALGIGIEAPASITGLGRVSSGDVIPNDVPSFATEAERDLERLKSVTTKRDQASVSDDDQQTAVADSLKAVYAVHDGIANGTENPVMTGQDAQIITLPLRAEPMSEPQDMISSQTQGDEPAVVIPFAPIPEPETSAAEHVTGQPKAA